MGNHHNLNLFRKEMCNLIILKLLINICSGKI